MSRNLPTAFATALDAQVLRPALLFEGEFADGWLRLWSGVGDLSWGGFTWTGAGTLLQVGSLEETQDVVASGSTVTLSGVPVEVVETAINQAEQGAPGRVYLALFDANWALIDNPVLAFAGRLDVPEVADGQGTCSVTISYESRLIDLTTPRELRYTHEAQRLAYPSDRGFEYVTSIQDKEITWGR